ncbi:MAG TPA: aminopeptidase [Gaiellaceae bacterium]|nr:aminopeptidase [Gaiellaceae bacterium]
MPDRRVEQYADLLLDTCLRVQPGWQVLVWGYPQARPLLEAVLRGLARRDAYPLLRLTFGGGLVYHREWVRHAGLDRLAEPAPIDADTLDRCDALLAVSAPENTRDGSDIEPERTAAVNGAYRRSTERVNASDFPWVMCWYPTPALAQDAGMPLAAFEDFLYGSVLLDWEAEHARLSRYAALFDEADEVRIVGDGTDLRLSLAGRRMEVDAGMGNMPGGEFFGCPVEDSAEGTISFAEFPQLRDGRQLRGVRLRFAEGRVVDASAEAEEDFLIRALDTDEGARRIGEVGIGCNPGITRYMGNVYFDEKIDGSVHLALGFGFADLGGTNESAIHWDLVKDLRTGGRIELDGRVVQENGRWNV